MNTMQQTALVSPGVRFQAMHRAQLTIMKA